MSLNIRRVHPQSLTRNAYLAERSVQCRTSTLDFRYPLRRISDPRINRVPDYSVATNDNLQSRPRFPKLIFNKNAKRANGVVNLNTACERKYRSWSDPTGEYTEDTNVYRPTATFYKSLNTTGTSLPKLRRDINTTRDNCEAKSFCDILSNYPCSSITRSLMSSPVTDEEEVCVISKHKTVLNWIYGIERTS